MKRIHYYLVLSSIIFISVATSCPQDDPCENITQYIDVADTLKIKMSHIDNPKVNDTIWLSLKLPNKIKDINGKSYDLNLKNEDKAFPYVLVRLKNKFNTYSGIDFGEFIIIKYGNLRTDNSSLSLEMNYNENLKSLYCEIGLILKEKGEYKFSSEGAAYFQIHNKNSNCDEFRFYFPLSFENGSGYLGRDYIITVN